MRIKGSFSLYKRRVPSGGTVFYYRVYDGDGKRSCGHSTGQSSISGAREYCNKLLREGRLGSFNKPAVPTFGEFAAGWWDYDNCPYLKSRKARREITKSYAAQGLYATRNHLVPAFGNTRLDGISELAIDNWMIGMTEQGYKHNSVNLMFKILKIMMGYAVKKKYIGRNPCEDIELLNSKDGTVVDILTPDEVVRLFPADWKSVWTDRTHFVLNKLAACTGMRHGELLGLRFECVHDNYIEVCKQYNKHGYVDVKSHKPRNIPIPLLIKNEFESLAGGSGSGFIFSDNGGEKPVSRKAVYQNLYAALEKIGIDGDERRRRHLTPHGWRHFFNTTLIMANLSDKKVRSVIGHSSDSMTMRYNHIKASDLDDVRDVQSKLVETKSVKPGVGKTKTVARKKSG
jgi:integrase